MRPTRVVVADDDAAFRGALVDVLRADARFEVVGAVPSGTELVPLVARVAADLVLVDVRMPDGGPAAARALRDAVQDGVLRPLVVVGISAQAPARTVATMLRAGAVGFLVKGHLGGDLGSLLARCVRGELVVAAPSGAEALRQLVEDAPVGV